MLFMPRSVKVFLHTRDCPIIRLAGGYETERTLQVYILARVPHTPSHCLSSPQHPFESCLPTLKSNSEKQPLLQPSGLPTGGLHHTTPAINMESESPSSTYWDCSEEAKESPSPQDPLVEENDIHPFVESFFGKVRSNIEIEEPKVDAKTIRAFLERYQRALPEKPMAILRIHRREYESVDPDRSAEEDVFCQLAEYLTLCCFCAECPGTYVVLMLDGKNGAIDQLGRHLWGHDDGGEARRRGAEIYASAVAAMKEQEMDDAETAKQSRSYD